MSRGTHEECTTNNIDNAWAPLAEWLRCNGRQAFNTETGGGNVASCQTLMCQQVAFQNANSDGTPSAATAPRLFAGLTDQFRSLLGLRRLGGGQLLHGIRPWRSADVQQRGVDGHGAGLGVPCAQLPVMSTSIVKWHVCQRALGW